MELIDREKLIAQYSANPETKGFMELVQDDCVVEALKRAEVVDAAPVVHAKWERPVLINNHWYRCCSNCLYSSAHGAADNKEFMPNFCSNCGAKMDLE